MGNGRHEPVDCLVLFADDSLIMAYLERGHIFGFSVNHTKKRCQFPRVDVVRSADASPVMGNGEGADSRRVSNCGVGETAILEGGYKELNRDEIGRILRESL